ncbi:MAG TPA: hypothetical protein VGQ41_22465 [Pyrinomonadaceae bacterium]|nr:hypothetical protein [Pyrinomonadaceae bacterium]
MKTKPNSGLSSDNRIECDLCGLSSEYGNAICWLAGNGDDVSLNYIIVRVVRASELTNPA